jgi:uncharacterized membrane protein YcaP (DUF421 family)
MRMWFESWSRLGVLLVAGVVAYGALVVILRVSGKRTLAKLNAFDFVVTIALGSVLATVIVSREVPLLEGLAALSTLVALQLLVALVTSRRPSVRQLVTSSPTAVLVHGRLDEAALRRCRLTPAEVSSAVRQEGMGSLSQVDVVVLESDGSLSVIADRGDGSALEDVSGTGAGAVDTERPA